MYLFFHCFYHFCLPNGHFLGTFSGGFSALFDWISCIFGGGFQHFLAAFLTLFFSISDTFLVIFPNFWRISGTVAEDAKHNSWTRWAGLRLLGNDRVAPLPSPILSPIFLKIIFCFFLANKFLVFAKRFRLSSVCMTISIPRR